MQITQTFVFGDLLEQARTVSTLFNEGQTGEATVVRRSMLKFLAKQDLTRLEANRPMLMTALSRLGHPIATNTVQWLSAHCDDAAVSRFWDKVALDTLVEAILEEEAA